MNKTLVGCGIGFFVLEVVAILGFSLQSFFTLEQIMVFGGVGVVNLIFAILLIVGAVRG